MLTVCCVKGTEGPHGESGAIGLPGRIQWFIIFFISKIRPLIYLTSRSLRVLFVFDTGEKGKPGAAGLSGYPGAPGEKGDKGTFGKDGATGEKGERVRANRNRNLKHNRTDGF